MRSLRIRKQVALPVPRPFRLTRCTVASRGEVARVLTLVDAAFALRRDEDGAVATSVVFERLVAAEPELAEFRDDFAYAASLGVALQRVQSGEAHNVSAASVKSDSNHLDLALWNALGWAGIEIAGRLPARLAAYTDYGVRLGHYLAHHGISGVRNVETELHEWMTEHTLSSAAQTFAASIDGHMVGEFWVDHDGTVRGRTTMPIRPARSIEKLYDELIFDIAWDELHESLGRGRPRKTEPLDHLVAIDWEPTLAHGGAYAAPIVDLRDHAMVEYVAAGGDHDDQSAELDFIRSTAWFGEPDGYHDDDGEDELADGGIYVDTGAVELNVVERSASPLLLASNGASANGHARAAVAVVDAFDDQLDDAPDDALANADLPAAGWYPDPLDRFEHRWWDGLGWTAAVASRGVVLQDGATA